MESPVSNSPCVEWIEFLLLCLICSAKEELKLVLMQFEPRVC